jgi:NAD(P)-dependent dehydrogenase (short-subunit alcohol dehydrogenase family)
MAAKPSSERRAAIAKPRPREDILKIELTGRTAVVSGSTGGIGRAIAEGLARAGASVVINGRGEARVQAALDAMRQAIPGARIEGVAADLATPEGAAAFIARADEADILVNNLGSATPKPFDQLTDDDWLEIFQLNVMSGVRLSRHYLAAMVKRGWGRVVFVSSESGLNIPKEMINYGMTKTAQLAISRGLAESVAGTGVTVNAVLPGPTRSEGMSNYLNAAAAARGVSEAAIEQQFLKALRPTSLLGRFATCEEVANMVVYVCSEQASATSGAALRVDGGIVRFVA